MSVSSSATDLKLSQAEPDVYPVHMLDDSSTNRPLTLTWMFRFNDMLDAEKLRDSLTTLLEIGDWKKLSGRIKRKADGQLEIHVPPYFSDQEPAVGFSHDVFDMPIRCHSLGNKLPEATKNLSVHAAPEELKCLWVSGAEPKYIQNFIDEQLPQLHLHVTSFTDDTLVFLRWNHTTFDAQGVSDMLKNWSLVLAGHAEKVEPFLGARKDVLEDLAPPTSDPMNEPYEQQPSQLQGFKKILFMLRLLWDGFRSGPQDLRLVCLPRHAVERLKAEAQLDEVSDAKGTIVGEGDTLTAWAAHVVATSQQQNRPLSIWNAVNCRFRLRALANTDGVYPQNMALPMVFTNLSSKQALGPIGNIARANRQCVMRQATEEQTLSYLRLTRKERDSGKSYMPMFGSYSAIPVFFNNMTKLSMLNAFDFSPAVTKQSDRPRSNKVGMPTYHHYHSEVEKAPKYLKIPTFVVFGKDQEQNYWLSISGTPPLWEKLEQEAKRLNASV